MFTCTVKSSYGYSLIRPFKWTTVLVHVHTLRENQFIVVGGDMAHSTDCYWTVFQSAKQATNKLASGWQNPCLTINQWTAFQCCTLHIYALLFVWIRCVLPLKITGFLFCTGCLLQIYAVWVPGQGPHRQWRLQKIFCGETRWRQWKILGWTWRHTKKTTQHKTKTL